MIVRWEWWPWPQDGEQGDPESVSQTIDDIEGAMRIKANLQRDLSSRLISIETSQLV